MPPFVGGNLGEHGAQTHFQEARDGGGDFDAAQIQAVGAGQLKEQLALDVEKGRQHGGYGLAVQRNKVPRRGQGGAHRRLGLVDDKPVDGAVLKGTLAGEATSFAVVDGLLDGADFPLPDHSKVSQAFLDGPIHWRRAPVEQRLVEPRGKFAGLLLDLFKLPAIEFEFGNGHSGDYSEGLHALA